MERTTLRGRSGSGVGRCREARSALSDNRQCRLCNVEEADSWVFFKCFLAWHGTCSLLRKTHGLSGPAATKVASSRHLPRRTRPGRELRLCRACLFRRLAFRTAASSRQQHRHRLLISCCIPLGRTRSSTTIRRLTAAARPAFGGHWHPFRSGRRALRSSS